MNDTLIYGTYRSSSLILSNSSTTENSEIHFKAGTDITLNCVNIVYKFTNTLLPGEQAIAVFNANDSQVCISPSSSVWTTVTSDRNVEITSTPLHISHCNGVSPPINYSICNLTNDPLVIDYIIDTSAGINCNSNCGGSVPVAGNDCEQVTITIQNNQPINISELVEFQINAAHICLTNTSSTVTGIHPNCTFSFLDATVFLGGADVGFNSACEFGMIRNHDVPNIGPYPALGYVQVGTQTENVCNWANSNTDIIDWVFVKLRDAVDPTIVHHTRNALLHRDGSIIDINSQSGQLLPLAFHNVNSGNYHVAVRHRNHLDVMTNTPLSFATDTITLCNFSDGSQASNVQGDITFNDLICGQALRWRMYAGDVNNDGVISASDRSIISNNQGQTGYVLFDCVLSNLIDNFDYDRAWDNRNKVSNVP